MSEAKKGEKHPMFGKKLSKETKQKLSEAHRGEKSYMFGKTLSEETKQKLSEATKGDKHHMYGKKHNEETKQKISEAQLGKIHCEDTRRKMSEAHRGEKNHRSKRVYQYDLDGTFIGSFGTSEEAVIYLNEKWAANINKCARGECNSAYGYKWSRTKK
jgi:group I intron endonuclease